MRACHSKQVEVDKIWKDRNVRRNADGPVQAASGSLISRSRSLVYSPVVNVYIIYSNAWKCRLLNCISFVLFSMGRESPSYQCECTFWPLLLNVMFYFSDFLYSYYYYFIILPLILHNDGYIIQSLTEIHFNTA